MSDAFIGEPPDCRPGTFFESRMALSAAGLHRPSMAGIAGTKATGAESIVLNGGYEDDEDFWDYIVYTGHGGNDASGRQIADQELTRGNLALARSCDEGLPVRVVRGSKEPSGFGPESGYRYDGLYYVERYWQDKGKSGFRIWRFRLVRDPATSVAPPATVHVMSPRKPRQLSLPTRIRSLAAKEVKTLEGHACQICGLVLRTPSGPYAETVHIRPLGAPHHGSDSADNLLCVCPNHRVLLETGALTVAASGEVTESASGAVVGRMRCDAAHSVASESLDYHARIHQARSSRSAG